ncbi:MAG: hypothetical protein FJ014_03010 [Chloroflexi bacterium]|nr:hypothetical protein [Chloroflexota bacterium]
MPNYDKLSVVVSVILLCLALSLIVVLPTETLSFVVLGSPLTIRFSQNWLVAALLAGMACSGTASIVRLHPLSREGKLPPTFVSCILPGLATLVAAIILPRAPDRIYTLGGLAVMGILLPLLIAAEYYTIDPAATGSRTTRLGLNFIAYLLALALFALVHESKAPHLLIVAAALAGSSLLALDVLHGAQQSFRRTGLYALIVGLVMGEIVWALGYSQVNSLTAGILLLLIFYLITGLARQGLLKLLDRRILIEFAVVALIGLALLLRYSP